MVKELVKEAMRRYPIGTICYSAHPDYLTYKMKIRDFNHHCKTEKEIFCNGDLYDGKDYNPCIYYMGRWAQIISLPEGYNKNKIIKIW